MDAQRARARAAQSFKANAQLPMKVKTPSLKVIANAKLNPKSRPYKDGEQVNELNEGDEGAIVIDFTRSMQNPAVEVDVGYIFAGETA